MIIYLVRHAQSEGNAKGFFQGNIDSPLTPLGLKQAAHLAGWLAGSRIRPQVVYASPLQRASHTARILTERLELPAAIATDNLREYRAGELEGLLADEVNERFPQYKNRSLEERGDFSAFGGDSYEDMQRRLKDFIGMVDEKHSGDDVIMAVCHGGTLYQLLKLWCGWPTPRHYFTRLDNCTVIKLVTREIAGVKAAELQWMIPLELTGWQADGGQAGSGRADWVERQ